MIAATILVGIGSGLLVAGCAARTWVGLRQPGGAWQTSTPRATQILGGLAAVALLVGAGSTWLKGGPALAVLVMLLAAIAALPVGEARAESRWQAVGDCALALALSALALIAAHALEAGSPAWQDLPDPPLLMSAVALGCGALAVLTARGVLAHQQGAGRWLPQAYYGLLTLALGSAASLRLIQRGSAWAGSSERLLLTAWLAWSGLWLARRWPARLHTGLTLVTNLTIIVVALAAG